MKIKLRGFTLIELMVTLVIVSVFSVIAVPSLTQFYTSSKLVGTANELLNGLAFTRAESIKRGLPVTICPSSNGTSCGTNWNTGWIVFADRNGNGVFDVPTAPALPDVLLRVREAIDAGYTVSSNIVDQSGTAVNFLTYSPSGVANDIGVIAVCYKSDEATARIITVTLTRAKIATAGEVSITNCENP